MTVASEVPAAAGWQAHTIHQSDGGIWYAHIDKVIDYFGPNQILAADDKVLQYCISFPPTHCLDSTLDILC